VRVERPPHPLRLVAGVDCAFGTGEVFASAVLYDVETGVAVETRGARRPLRFPYVPGLLSFREAPAILAALRALRGTPDALLCDGHGLAHPRRFGIACHLGVLCDLPSVGVAKSLLVGTHSPPGERRGQRSMLRHHGECIGSVLRTRAGVRPVYVSVGHRIDLPSAVRLVLRCATGFRLPEPTRLADLAVAAARRA
jgi:deoxyribonuclease V